MTTVVATPLACEACPRPAVLETPYGIFCVDHTLEVMDADREFWMPHIIDTPVRTDK
jgi:hypothetical protein